MGLMWRDFDKDLSKQMIFFIVLGNYIITDGGKCGKSDPRAPEVL